MFLDYKNYDVCVITVSFNLILNKIIDMGDKIIIKYELLLRAL